MTSLIWRSGVLLWIGIAVASADERCPHPDTLWSCAGSVEVGSMKDGTFERRRMTRLTGGEILAEVEGKDVLARALVVKPSGLILYQGIDDVKAAKSTNSPFLFFNEAVGWGAFLPLHTGYPLGPDAVPDGSAEKVIEIDKIPVRLRTTRADSEQIKFSYEVSGTGTSVEGTWDRRQPSPWSDDVALSGWKHDAPHVIHNLREARSTEWRAR